MTRPTVNYLRVLDQDEVWVLPNGKMIPLDSLSPDHRANLIPFLRRRAKGLQAEAWRQYWKSDLSLAADGYPSDGVAALSGQLEADLTRDPQEWLAMKPLMVKLLEYERGRSPTQRRLTAIKNKAYELATGYRKQ